MGERVSDDGISFDQGSYRILGGATKQVNARLTRVSKLFRNVPFLNSLEVSPFLRFQVVAAGSAGVEPVAAVCAASSGATEALPAARISAALFNNFHRLRLMRSS